MRTQDLTKGLDLDSLVGPWKLSLEARNLSDQTVYIYGRGLDVFRSYLKEAGVSTAVDAITREHIEAAFVWMQTPNETRPAYSDHTVATFYDGIASFWRWATAEGEVDRNPMGNVTKPIIPDARISFPTDEEMGRLVKSVPNDFAGRRDVAIVRLFASTGLRLSELTNLPWDAEAGEVPEMILTRDESKVWVVGKGRKPRPVSLGSNASMAMDKYLRARREHPNRDLPWLWISDKGRMTTSGIRQMLNRRSRKLDLDIGPHQLRHYYVNSALAGDIENGVPPRTAEEVAKSLGHTSTKMIYKTYGALLAQERSMEVNRRWNPGDRF